MHAFLQRLEIPLPILQAPMAGVQDLPLAFAVARAGGLGALPCALFDLPTLAERLDRIAQQPHPINLNFFCHTMAPLDPAADARWRTALYPYYADAGIDPPTDTNRGVRRPIDDATVDLLERHRPRALSFHFGLPSPPLLARIKRWGATVLASATTLDEARWLERHGADVVIAQGIEAGGHRGHFLSHDLALQPPLDTLLADCVAALSVPVVAAGGIGDRRDVDRLLAAGAAAVQVGTAYLLSPEASTSAVHRAALQQPGRDAAITNLISGRPARGLVNRLMRDLGPISDAAPPFPWATPALAPLRAHAEALGRDDFTPLWCGTRPGTFADVDAATITRTLAGKHTA